MADRWQQIASANFKLGHLGNSGRATKSRHPKNIIFISNFQISQNDWQGMSENSNECQMSENSNRCQMSSNKFLKIPMGAKCLASNVCRRMFENSNGPQMSGDECLKIHIGIKCHLMSNVACVIVVKCLWHHHSL